MLARDALVLLLLALFIWLGFRVKRDVDHLDVLGHGVAAAGSSIRAGFRSAASAASGIPLAGGDLAGALRDAGRATGGNVAAIGQAGENGAHHLGTVLGLLIWGIPTLLLLLLAAPRRIREARQLRDLRRVLTAPNAEQRQRLLAARAVMTLPEDVLFAHSPDPAGDLLAGRYQPLAEAALEAGGVRPSSGSAHTT